MSWFVRGLVRLSALLVVLGGLCVGIGFLVTRARGGSALHAIALTFYVGGALAVGAAVIPRGSRYPSAYGGTFENEALSTSNADRNANVLVGLGLVAIGLVLDALSS